MQKPNEFPDIYKNLIDLGIDLIGLKIRAKRNIAKSRWDREFNIRYYLPSLLFEQPNREYKGCTCFVIYTTGGISLVVKACEICILKGYDKYPYIIEFI